jgi:hypothetical protein
VLRHSRETSGSEASESDSFGLALYWADATLSRRRR